VFFFVARTEVNNSVQINCFQGLKSNKIVYSSAFTNLSFLIKTD